MAEPPLSGQPDAEDAWSFLHNEFATLSLMAGLGTRNAGAPVYTDDATDADRAAVKKHLSGALRALGARYGTTRVAGPAHVRNIQRFRSGIPADLARKLVGSRLRYGVAQKVVNLYLKYLWVVGYVHKPPHCPIDRRIAEAAHIDYRWTENDDEGDYLQAVAALRERAAGQELADWELAEFEKVRISATQKQG